MNYHQAYPTLPWLARSPDLSPIEYLRDVMERRLQPSRNVDDLAQQCETIWHETPQDAIRELNQAMPQVTAYIQARSRPTPYRFLPFVKIKLK
ncbi:transposable element Tc1 transposase [Trichonephila clavipes]|nr:transposable element Tc1 transposase [Trichonephila clavipes]